MKLILFSKALLFIGIFGLAPRILAARSDGCADLRLSKQTLRSTSTGLTSVWVFSEKDFSQGPFVPSSTAEKSHIQWVRQRTSWSSRENLRNGIRIRQKTVNQLPRLDVFRLSLERDIRNLSKVINGSIGRIRPLRCIEGLAFREYLRIADLRSHPQEFQAIFMEKDGVIAMLGDFYRKKPSDIVGTMPSAATLKYKAQLEQKGWVFHAHLHNHPFDFTNTYGDIGGSLAPSDPDLEIYLSQKPRYALITNGIETIEIPQKDFSKFERAK
ncbi:MAG: hypothetical protein KF789_02890 [Bdellovibrionaceae bacterium]|nr:hypothetical protein [Pseudobdellovibrionaceae bacterium]